MFKTKQLVVVTMGIMYLSMLSGCSLFSVGSCDGDEGQIDLVQTWPDTLRLNLRAEPHHFDLNDYYVNRQGFSNRYVAGSANEEVATAQEFDSILAIQTQSIGTARVFISWGAIEGGLECRDGGRSEFVVQVTEAD